MTDNAHYLQRALDQIDRVIAQVPADALAAPTPCDDYDVTALINHLTVVANRLTAAASDGPAQAPAPEPEAIARWETAHDAVTAAIQAANPATMAHLPFGQMPLDAAFAVYVGEFTTHGWDLAVALGRSDLLDDNLAEIAVRQVTARIPDAPRDRTPFGDVVAVAHDAPAYDRLAGWMGRDPKPWRTAS